ncbi:MAG: SO_0444 family Cu/Zn efflux transporter [Deltaproteobacteria bacterium]|jgi:uncharacterized membrane protein YraQ (UPF0718 family)|nr:SO_0444 family Cu/Zn efflux transporter [Deltaproteobacteria bacterium]MCW9049928.1 SO_0444 family Cu/Zn efflux transporter [Deltaproteobacteria bacterium]
MILFEKILLESWNVLCLSAPYMLFGFFVAGLLKAFIPDDFIARHLGKENRSSLVKAALFGVPIPLCSCGVLPAAAGIRKQGASKGATAAFLISTPETGVDSIAVTWALLDPLMAFFRPLSAFLTALLTGQLVRVFDPDSKIKSESSSAQVKVPVINVVSSDCVCGPQSCSPVKKPGIMPRLQEGMRFAFGDLFRDISGWFFFGVGIAGIITVFVSPELVENWLGNPIIAMFVMLLVGTPLYVCATASTPIAAALVLKGLNPGAALVFLLVGPATNAAALSVISRILGKKSTVIYLAGIMVSSFLLGFTVDALYSFTNLTAGWQAIAHEDHRTFIGTLSALMLFGLVLFPKSSGECSDAACGCGRIPSA